MAITFTCSEPETVFAKIDECCVLVKQIDSTSCIGDTLASINFNFNNLDAHVCNLELSARRLWNPMWALIASNSAAWDSVYSTVYRLSSCWQSAYLTVRDLSAAFLDPISVVYPEPFPVGTPTDTGTILTWVQSNFPITGDPDVDGCNAVNYPEGQKLWVFSPELGSATQTLSETVQPPCAFKRAKISVFIRTINFGAGSYRSSQVWLTEGQSVKAGTGHWYGRATLHEGECTSSAVTTTGTYTDKYVDSIDGLEFCVVGGVWAYIGAIPGY